MQSVYEKCGRYEGVAYYDTPLAEVATEGARVHAANYDHTLAGAWEKVQRRHPEAARYEVVEHEAHGLGGHDVVMHYDPEATSKEDQVRIARAQAAMVRRTTAATMAAMLLN